MTDNDKRPLKNANTDDLHRRRIEKKGDELVASVPPEIQSAATRLQELVTSLCDPRHGGVIPGSVVASMLIGSGIGMYAAGGTTPDEVREICEENLVAVYKALPR